MQKYAIAIFGVVLLFVGGGVYLLAGQKAKEAARIKKAKQLTASDKGASVDGLVYVRGTPTVPQPLVLTEGRRRIPCLHYVKTKRERVRKRVRRNGKWRTKYRTETSTLETRWVPSFQLEGFTVVPKTAECELPTELHSDRVNKVTYEWKGVRANKPVTVVGTLSSDGQTLKSGEPFIVSPHPLEAIQAAVAREGSTMKIMGAIFGVVGIGFIVAFFFVGGSSGTTTVSGRSSTSPVAPSATSPTSPMPGGPVASGGAKDCPACGSTHSADVGDECPNCGHAL